MQIKCSFDSNLCARSTGVLHTVKGFELF